MPSPNAFFYAFAAFSIGVVFHLPTLVVAEKPQTSTDHPAFNTSEWNLLAEEAQHLNGSELTDFINARQDFWEVGTFSDVSC